MTTRILCVADGGITPAMMSALKELESYDAEVTIVEDSQMTSMAEITDRMGVIERAGIVGMDQDVRDARAGQRLGKPALRLIDQDVSMIAPEEIVVPL